MLKEFKNDIAKMYSLMARMDKHMTLNESKDFSQYLLTEANGGTMFPKAKIQVIEDKANKVKKVLVTITYLTEQDVYKILHTQPFSTDPNCTDLDVNGTKGIRLSKALPYREIQHRTAQANASTDPSQQQASTAPSTGGGGMKARLKAKKQGIVTEGLKSRLQQKHQQPTSAPAGQPPTGQASATAPQASATVANPTDAVYKWLKKYVDKIHDILSQNPIYDKTSLDDEVTAEALYASYMGTVAEDETLYPAQTVDRLKKDIAEAIKNGTWTTVMPKIMPAVNLDAVLYGHILRPRNVNAITYKAASYGLNPGDANYPKLVLAATEWLRYFKRRVLPGAHRYPIVVPMNDTTSKKKGDMGTKQHMINMGADSDKKGYTTKIGYDVSETEPIDPTDPRNYLDDQAGLTDNMSGKLNMLAIAEKNANMAAKLASLSQQQQQVMSDTQTVEGQSRYWNEGLVKSVKILGLGLNLPENTNVPNPVEVYANNMLSFAQKIVEAKGITKPQIAHPMIRCIAFGIACKTVGQQEVLSLASGKFNNTADLGTEWSTYADQIIESIKNIFNSMVDYLETKYKGNVTDPSSSSAQPAQQATPVAEGKINNLEYLLESFIS